MKIEVGAMNLETAAGGDVQIFMLDGQRAIGAYRNQKLWHGETWLIPSGESLSDMPCTNLREKEPLWHENISPVRIPCWVSDTNPTPTDRDNVDVFTAHHKIKEYPFICERQDWRYATPINPSGFWRYKGEGK